MPFTPGAAFVHAAAWWDADAGPPCADLLPRDQRLGASFSTRMLAHVLDHVGQRSAMPLHHMPWVLGSPEAAPELEPHGPTLHRALGLPLGLACVHAGPATVAMTLLEALGQLADHPAVLVAFVRDATPPHHEAIASALLLSRSPRPEPTLVLVPPSLRRTSSHSPRAVVDPLAAARALARAVFVGSPTVETVPSAGLVRPDGWRIELRFAS